MTSIERDNFLETCKGVVMHCDCTILVLNVMGEYRAYLTNSVRLKNRECRYNEVIDAQDITVLIKNVESNFQLLNRQKLDERVQSIHKVTFKFGTDDYLWLTRVDVNRG